MPIKARANPKAEYHVYGAAADLFSAARGEVILSGPAGTGKSRACLQYLHYLATNHPGMRGLIARKTRESLTQTALVTFEEKVLTRAEYEVIAAGTKRSGRQSYRYPNGSELVVGGLDRPTKIMSTEFDVAYVQEAIELLEDDWESITTRLRNGVTPRQQIIADTNPDGPQHWIKRRADAGRLLMLESRHEDNPMLWDRESSGWTKAGLAYIGKLDGLTGVRKPRLRYGKWVQAEGAVYEEWDRAVHIVDRFEIPGSWRRIRSIDFGYTNPFVCLWIAIDHDGRMYVYREMYKTRRTVKVHAGEIRRLSGDERYEFTVADHDAEDRATLLENGIPTRAANKAVTRGIEAVQERLKVAGDGRPRLFYLRDSLVERDEGLVEAKKPCGLTEEIDGYAWSKGDDGRTLGEEPVKLNDHAVDALRYAAMAIDRGVGRIEPAEVVEARERAEAEEAERLYRDINADHWWR